MTEKGYTAAEAASKDIMKAELKITTYTPNEIAKIVGGSIVEPGGKPSDCVTNICTDSREVKKGSLFVAIRGERVDGHDYMSAAVDAGAVCFLAERVPENLTGKSCAVVLVDDPIRALGELAADYRSKSAVKVIAITGSVGKTTTKEFIAAVAAAGYQTHKTEGNHNNDLGLAMTLFTLERGDKISVLEMGMSNLGEIERLSSIAKPDIAVVTNIGTSHLASLGTRENICRAKMEITAGMKADGILLLNADEPLLAERARTVTPAPLFMSIGNSLGDYRAVNIRTLEDGMVFDLICRDHAVTNVKIPTLGKHNVYNALVAYAIGTLLDLPEETIRLGLMGFRGAAMRQKIYEMGLFTVIEDCYNASPESMRAALDVLAAVASQKNAKSAALLGDMLELGDYARLMHDQLGQYAAQTKVDLLFCYGMMADVVAEAAIKHGIRADNVYVSLDTREPEVMAKMILGAIEPGSVLLVKASRAVAAERVLECMKNRRRKKV